MNIIGCDLFLSKEAYIGLGGYLDKCEVRLAVFEGAGHYVVSPPVGDFLDAANSEWREINSGGAIHIYKWCFDEARTAGLHVIRQEKCRYIFVSSLFAEELVALKKKKKVRGFILTESHWDRSPIKG